MHDSENCKSLSRRDFLRASASAGTALGGLTIASSAHAAGSGTIRVGVIGSGTRGPAAAQNAMNAGQDIHIVAIADICMDRIQQTRTALKAKYPDQVAVDDAHCFTGFEAYRHVIESSDVVIIANAAKFHPMHLRAALEAGKHVFLEKPHAIDPYGIHMLRAALDLAARKKLCVVSGLQSRYHPGYQETIKRVHDGAIGEIVSIQETWLRAPYILRERKSGMTEVEHQAANQYHFHWLSGDDLTQTLIHNLDRSSWAMHDQAPVRAWGLAGRSTLKGEVYGDVFDHHSAVYEFANGVKVYAYCRTIDNCYDENSSIIYGTKGRCDLLKLQITGETNWEHPGPKSKNGAYDLEHVALFNAIRSGTTINNGDYMVRSTQFALLGQFACYTGKLVTWDQMTASQYCHLPRPEDVRADMEAPVKPGPDGVYPLPFTPGAANLNL